MDSQASMTPAEFASALNVSRETMARLEAYEALLRQWQARINLVSQGSLDDVWRRHFFDSGQLCRFIGEDDSVADIGSGAGFPGLIIAIMVNNAVSLVESDHRKAAFLREASRVASADATIIAARAETVAATPADIVVARAVAPLDRLLGLAERWVKSGGACLFLKGAAIKDELTDADRIWDINYDLIPSLSDPAGVILHVKEFRRV